MIIGRKAHTIFSVVACILAAGPIYGFPALKRVFVSQKVYHDLCTIEELAQEIQICAQQELLFNRMFTYAVSASAIEIIVVEWLVSKASPKICGILSCLIMAFGIFLLSNAQDISNWDGYMWGYLFLAMAGPFVYVGSLSTVFHSGTTLALLTAALDASAFVFPVYRVLYDKFHILPEKFFTYYLIVPLILLVGYGIMAPSSSGALSSSNRFRGMRSNVASRLSWENSTELENSYHDDPSALTSADPTSPNTASSAVPYRDEPRSQSPDEAYLMSYERTMRHPLKDTSGIWGAMHDFSLSQQIQSNWFVLIFWFASIACLHINFFISTVWKQYAYLLDSWASSADVSTLLEYALPLGGLVSSPLIGIMLDRISTFKTFIVLSALTCAVGVLNLFAYKPIAYICVVLFVIYRPFLLTAVSDYAVRVFGLDTFSSIYGILWFLIGLVNLFQLYLADYYINNLESDPFWINFWITLVTTGLGLILVAYIWFQGKRIRRKQLEEEARSAPIEPMPGSSWGPNT